MTDRRPHLVVAESGGFDAEAAATLETSFRVSWLDADRSTLKSSVVDADALWVRLRHHIDGDLIAAAPRLTVVATPTTGHTHLDEVALAARDIAVCSLRGETEFLRSIRATAEHTVLLMLAALRHLPGATRSVNDGRWDRDAFRGGELSSRTVGIVGWGRLGRMVGELAAAFGARVVMCDPHVADAPVPNLGLHALFATADIVSLHVALTPSTTGLIDEVALQHARPGAWLVNTARGEVVDEGAVERAVLAGTLAGYATDVLCREQSAGMGDHPLVRRAAIDPRFLITPHIGGATAESMARTERHLARRLVARWISP